MSARLLASAPIAPLSLEGPVFLGIWADQSARDKVASTWVIAEPDHSVVGLSHFCGQVS